MPVDNVVAREIRINAKPETIFAYLVQQDKLRRWITTGGTMDPRPGGAFRFIMSDEDTASGTYVTIDPPRKLAFTWGWEGDDAVTKPGSSLVEITLTADGDATLVKLVHSNLPNAQAAESHGKGWQHYLGRLATVSIGMDPGPDPVASGGVI